MLHKIIRWSHDANEPLNLKNIERIFVKRPNQSIITSHVANIYYNEFVGILRNGMERERLIFGGPYK